MDANTWQLLALVVGFGITVVILGIALIVLWKIFTGAIDLTFLIAETDGKASLSRFQFLVFTFVVAGVFLLLSLESGTFVDLPNNVLILLGLSGGGYAVSKGISASAKKADPTTETKGAPEKTDVPPVA